MRVKYSPDVDILIIELSDRTPVESEYLEDVGIVVDFDENNRIVAIEILSFSKRKSRGNFLEKDDLLETMAI